MAEFDLVRRRLDQHIGRPSFAGPADVVRWFGAVQAQDYLGALWAIGLRTPGSREGDIERALSERTIVRTWPMRGTLHFVAAADVRWMLDLLAPHVVARSARRLGQLGLDDALLTRSRRIVTRLLRDGGRRTRRAMYEALEAGKISAAGQRGIHILWRLAQDGLLCFGPREGKEHTFVLLEEWLPEAKRLRRDEALAQVALRYFTGHGPATVQDFAWWSGLPASEARAALDMVRTRLERATVEDRTYWFLPPPSPRSRSHAPTAHFLPAFDEYLVGYRDRASVLADGRAVNAGGGMLAPTTIVEGRVVATWRRTLRTDAVLLEATPFARLRGSDPRALAAAAKRYGDFLGRRASLALAER